MGPLLQWRILGTGAIGHTFARSLAGSTTGKLIAVGSRTQHSADLFGDEHKIPRRYPSYDALLRDKEVEAVYIATPHPMHVEWAIKAANARKHILCEKPLTMNRAEALAVIDAARQNGIFLMEAFMYRCHPQTRTLVELLRAGIIGDVRLIQATFSFHSDYNLHSRLLNKQMGGGSILDVGCYCTAMARLIAGVAIGKDFVEPIDVTGVAHIGAQSGVDEYALALLKFPCGILAQLASGVQVAQESIVRIYGSEGSIFVPSPWMPSYSGGNTTIFVQTAREWSPQAIVVEVNAGLYAIEADTVAAHLQEKQAPSPAMTWDDTLGNMETLDRWRESVGLIYEGEPTRA